MPNDEKGEPPPRVPGWPQITPTQFNEEAHFDEVRIDKQRSSWWWKPPSDDVIILLIFVMCLSFYFVCSVFTFAIAVYARRQISDYLGIPESADQDANIILGATVALFIPVMVLSLVFTKDAKLSLYKTIGNASQWIFKVWREIVFGTLCLLFAVFSLSFAAYYVFTLLSPKTQVAIIEAIPVILTIFAMVASIRGHHGIKDMHLHPVH
jgi:hypothetical protein